MVTKLVSSNQIIAKVIADMDLSDSQVRPTDIIEWIGESLEHIGAIHQYSKEVSGVNSDVIEICNHQAKLPCNIKDLISVAYSRTPHGGWIPMRSSTNTFNRWSDDNCQDSQFEPSISDTNADCLSITRLYMDMHKRQMNPHEAIRELNGNPNAKQTLKWLVKEGNRANTVQPRRQGAHATDFTRDITYSVKPGYINTNIQDGWVKLAYTTVPIDEDGYPLVPDIAAVKEAVYWYVAMKILYPKYLSGSIPQYAYFEAKGNWTRWSNSAHGRLNMPNMDELLSAKNVWNSIYPNMREEQTFYDTTGESEVLYDFNRRHGWYYQNPRLSHAWSW